MQNQIFEKKHETPIEMIISTFEEIIIKHGAIGVQQMQNKTRIEKIYEIPSKGGIIARFVPPNGPRFTNTNPDKTLTPFDTYIMYLGFDESSKKYSLMVSDVQNALEGK